MISPKGSTYCSTARPPSNASEPASAPLWVSANGQQFGIGPFELSFFAQPTVVAVNPGLGPTSGGTPITIRASGLEALGTYTPPATGEARCRWGRPWLMLNAAIDEVLQYTAAIAVSDQYIVCPTPPQGYSTDEAVSFAINGQQFILANGLTVKYYRQPGQMQLLEGRLRGPSAGGTRWRMYDHSAGLLDFKYDPAPLTT